MTITHAEFLRSLRPLKRHYQIKISDDPPHIFIADGTGQVHISLGPQDIQKLANLRLPSTEVELTLKGFKDLELEVFWSRFELCFRRGGG